MVKYQLDADLQPYGFNPEAPLAVEQHIFETHNFERKIIQIDSTHSHSFFKFFLDGCRRTYKVAELVSPKKQLNPVLGAQLAAGILERKNQSTLKKYEVTHSNIICVTEVNKDELKDLQKSIDKFKNNKFNFNILQYKIKDSTHPAEYHAIAKAQAEMLSQEIALLGKVIKERKLGENAMLLKDGSLQYSSKINDTYFDYVVGLAKTFNLKPTGSSAKRVKKIYDALPELKVGQRTPVFKADFKPRTIGTWFMRIHPRKYMHNPLDGVVKLEKVACTKSERENGLETSMVNNISLSILNERNVTCHGKDSRWPNHLYPIYMTEQMIKSNFLSTQHFTNLF